MGEHKHSYDEDVILWSEEQAEALRAGRWSELDLAHLADEIEDVGKSEKRELASRMAILLAHLLKWQFQPERRGASWQTTIRVQRHALMRGLAGTPSLKTLLNDEEWISGAWEDGADQALRESGLEVDFGETCPWTMDQVLTPDWLPEA